MPDASVLVACLCADWCGVCRDYRAVFDQVQSKFPKTRFVWIDVEDQADVVDPIEIDNFPTLLIAVGEEALFFGTITPQAVTLERLVRDRLEHPIQAKLGQPDVAQLVTRLHRLIDPRAW